MKPLTAFLLVVVALFLASCGTTYHLKRAEHHLKMAQVKGAVLKPDTVFVEKEVIVPEVKYDTVIERVDFRDTVTVVKDNIVTRLKVDTINKRVYISVKCPPDTVRIKVPVTITKTIESEFPWGWLVLAFIAGIVLGLFGTRATR